MPLYEYQCGDCGETVEALQRLSDPPLSKCAACGGELRRLLSAPAIQFKGSGWYITDYQGKNGRDSAKDDSSAKEEKAASTADSQTNSEVASTKKSENVDKD